MKKSYTDDYEFKVATKEFYEENPHLREKRNLIKNGNYLLFKEYVKAKRRVKIQENELATMSMDEDGKHEWEKRIQAGKQGIANAEKELFGEKGLPRKALDMVSAAAPVHGVKSVAYRVMHGSGKVLENQARSYAAKEEAEKKLKFPASQTENPPHVQEKLEQMFPKDKPKKSASLLDYFFKK